MTEEYIEKLESEYFRSYFDLRIFNRGREGEKIEISFGLESPGGGVTGELMMEWIDLGSHGISPQLTAFNDSIHVLRCFQDVLDEIHNRFDNVNYTPDEFIEVLKSRGFINSKTAFEGDYIPDDMFKQYQTKRKRQRSLKTILD